MSRRRQVSVIITIAIALGSLAFGPLPAGAQEGGCSGLDRAGTTCSIFDALNPSQATPGNPALSTQAPPGPRFVWLNLLLPCDASAAAGWTSLSNLSAAIFDISLLAGAGPPADPGVLWIGELIDPTTGGTNSGYLSCVGTGSPLPALPPPLPTADEIWGAALTFEPTVNLDPYVRGLTGLETYMWYEGPVSDAVTITLNGYTVAAQINAVEFRWDAGGESRDGVQRYESPTPGSADAPAAAHTYAVPSEVIVIHEIVWAGSAVISGPGIPAGGIAIDLGQALLAIARDYDVIEVRTPLVRG